MKASNGIHERLLASIYLWRGLHAQKDGVPDSTTLIIQNTTSACVVLRSLLNRESGEYTPRKTGKQIGGNSRNSGKKDKENKAVLSKEIDVTKNFPVTPKKRKSKWF